MYKINKLTTAIFIFVFFFNCKEEDKIIYFFPTKMKEINPSETDKLVNKEFKIVEFYSSDSSIKNELDSIVNFKSNGDILCNNKVIGYWKKNRNVFLTIYNKKFFIYQLNENKVKIHSRYVKEKDTVLNQIRLTLLFNNLDSDESIKNEFEF